MKKLNLSNVTLICADCINPALAIEAMGVCKYYCNFADIKFLTSCNIEYEHKVVIPPINSYSDYSRFIFHHLDDYVQTEFCLVVQWDGFILNPKAWTDEYFNYDYIGALLGPEELPEIVGNGGFSLRSKKLLTMCKEFGKNYNDKNIEYSEDLVICYFFRDFFERGGIKFATNEIANKFSTERSRVYIDSFGFHNFFFCNPVEYGWVNPIDPAWKPRLKS